MQRREPTSDNALISQHLAPDPANPDLASWRLQERAVPVWAIIGALTEAEDNASEVAADYGVSPEEVQAAVAYYRRYRCLIEARLAANAA